MVLSGWVHVGGEVGEVAAARVVCGGAVMAEAAGVLPCLPLAVPMKAELGQLPAKLGGWNGLELHPHPLAHDLGEVVNVGELGSQKMKQPGCGKKTIPPTAGEVHRLKGVLGLRAPLFGSVPEPCCIVRLGFHGLFL